MSRSGDAPFWKIGLAPYVTWREVTIFTIVTIVANCAVQFQALLLPYLLSEQIGVAASDQGKVSGMLASVQQLATLVMLGFAGHLADRIGRRGLMIVTMAGYTACFFIFPLVSTVAMLILVRILLGAFQAGHTAGGATRVVADYPDEQSRGRFISLTLVIQWSSVAVFVGLIGAKIPQWLVAAGLPTRLAGQVSFLIVAVLCALATLLSVTLSKNRAIDRCLQSCNMREAIRGSCSCS